MFFSTGDLQTHQMDTVESSSPDLDFILPLVCSEIQTSSCMLCGSEQASLYLSLSPALSLARALAHTHGTIVCVFKSSLFPLPHFALQQYL